jgi:glycosyltransferase involved in cell wall biosynthesis
MEKRVLQLCHGYQPPFLDVARRYVRLFDGSGYAVTTVFLSGPFDAAVADACHCEDVRFLEFGPRELRGLKRKPIARVRELCAELAPAFAVAHRYKPLYTAAHVDGLFVVGVHHAHGDYERWHRRRFVEKRADRIALLGVSDSVRDDIRAAMPGFPAERVATQHHGIDVDALRATLLPRAEARAELGIEGDVFVFGHVGRLHVEKDQKTLLDAFTDPRLAGSRLAMVGAGPAEADVHAYALSHGLANRVTCVGHVERAAGCFRAFDAFVLPSPREGFGLVLLEAMAAGVPIAASQGVQGIVGDAALLFPPGDNGALADALVELRRTSPLALQQKMEARLPAFTIEAARQALWAHPFLRAYAGASGA